MSQSRFHFDCAPLANPSAVVTAGSARFTVLTSRLIRMEFSSAGQFEDRPSQVFWFREQLVPPFEVRRDASGLEIETDALLLRWQADPAGFTRKSLSITLKASGVKWRIGDRDYANLFGTARTLDEANGQIQLEPGLVSFAGWSVVDDSASLAFDDSGWLQPRRDPQALDLYFFGYGHDYPACVRDYARLAGETPMLPRWALGNWWSRYWEYSQDELQGLMEDFRARQFPLSVCIIDMDWHITKTGNDSSGWTGYTWNPDLFPDPAAFLAWLHQQGLRTALNLHPAEGVHPHESAYPRVAQHMGIDPASGEPIPFDIADPRFASAYFDELHHPLEDQGVDFWWIDWQQGTRTRVQNLDPLYMLNHLHALDSARDGKRRPFIFSRWGGLGSHRYPIGFSGDSVVSWESLAFQPFFTATAANVNYGWWSHDIGGHMGGVENRELYTRWVQFGIFSPIMRVHSTKVAFQERRPWGWGEEAAAICRQAFQLRHALIPYIYSMAWRHHQGNLPLITPMYYAQPEVQEAYQCPDQYFFGSQLLAAPVLTPTDPQSGFSRATVWLPEGDWFNFFSGEYYPGGQWHALFAALDEIPVFARAGAIVPLAPLTGWGGTDNPSDLTLALFPGADNTFTLYEDDGSSMDYRLGKHCLTAIEQCRNGAELTLTVHPAQGDTALVPAARGYTLEWRGICPAEVSASVDGQEAAVSSRYDEKSETLTVSGIRLKPSNRLEVHLRGVDGSLISKRDRRADKLEHALHVMRVDSWVKDQLFRYLPAIIEDPNGLNRAARHLTEAQMAVLRAIIEKPV